MRRYLILLLFFVPSIILGANTSQVTNVSNSSRIYKTSFYLYAGREYEFRTESSSDTFLHLLYNSNSQITYNDDCGSNCSGTQGNLNSTIIFTPSSSGYYNLMMRHYSSGVVGAVSTIKQYENGTLKWSTTNRPVGGYKITIDSWDTYSQSSPFFSFRYIDFYYLNRSKEDVGGAGSSDTVMYLSDNYGRNITDFDDDNGASYSSKIPKLSGSCSSGCKVIGGGYPYSSSSEGNAKLVVNVRTTFGDIDFDGLSSSLETVLGTSSSNADSDGDGLNDYLETLGSGAVALPWEGSDPMVEDIFIEIDYMPVDSSRYSNPDFTNYYPAARTVFMQGNQGIDITEEMKYAFSHHDSTRVHIDVDDQIPHHNWMRCGDADDPNEDDINMDTMVANYFTSARSGIYRYIVFGDSLNKNYQTGDIVGMSCGGGRMMVALSPYNTSPKRNEYTSVTLHELGHDLSLTHNGSDDSAGCNDGNSRIFRSVMNYHYVGQFGYVPRIYSSDSRFRYATDAPNTYASPYEPIVLSDYDGTYGVDWDVDWSIGSSDIGCVDDPTVSTKQACEENPDNELCDCTFNAYTSGRLDYSGGGAIMGNAVMGSFEDETATLSPEERAKLMETEIPIIGVNGVVVSKNLKTLISSGEFVKKGLKEEKEKVQERDIKKLLGQKVIDRYNKLLKEKLHKRSDWKDGKNYFVNEKSGKVEFNESKYGYQEKE
ncbi:hypothetical protein KAH37_08145 [bacterium]|nr:hypothetical protein [bacterium]